MSSAAEIKAEILRLTREFSKLAHAANRPGIDPAHAPFIPGQTTVPYAGRVFDEDEVEAAVSSTLDFWLTLGPEGEAMEKELAAFMGVKHCLLVNSGSSANLVAFSALTTHKLPDHKRIRPGDEVITVAAGFPTTVAPIIQAGAVPVFIDAKTFTGNADCSLLEAAFSEGKTKAVMMAHALGNPFELSTVLEFCKKHDLWLVEDNCDALGCTYSLPVGKAKELGLDHLLKIADKGEHAIIRIEDGILTAPTGSFGDISTQSFYPPHHLTMGEGGAVNIIRRAPLKTYAESFRDWGRDCWCASGKDDTCGKRFQWQLGELPQGYDHKYIYSHLGFNLKPLDPQAAIGRVQIKRLPEFIEARKINWELLRRGLHGLEKYIDFALPTHATAWNPPADPASEPISDFTWDDSGCQTSCSWFGFKITIKEDAPFTRTELAAHLDANKIGNRMLFGGNLVRQPAFVQLRRDNPAAMRVAGELTGADRIMNQTMFLGTYPGLTREMIDYMVKVICDFTESKAA
ncbi:lipopolysaccharide biosynthesis protein RfbH [Luteolibacter pohnpeiensis]|uniref:Lipopolysaccharide biosynthesis protein RfbH n=1 Tax=Luteolibacter pohnpeiensis TaxID=454153 RepID=A0A934SAS2_9BACT|nr:lipopolysaccharide biosynthesis protein RfbH [Luteolibacter pohnpeiensis]MBK1882474.1 lipopolysaccharide biosynthesis protein RfbH [Luteolibacter pohnpeiensis]